MKNVRRYEEAYEAIIECCAQHAGQPAAVQLDTAALPFWPDTVREHAY
jgi:hypothetical protein